MVEGVGSIFNGGGNGGIDQKNAQVYSNILDHIYENVF